MKIGLSLILVIAAEVLLATAGASARGFSGGTFAGSRFAVQGPPHAAVERRVFAAPAARRRLVVERPFPGRRRIVVVPLLIVAPLVSAEPRIIILPLTDCPQ